MYVFQDIEISNPAKWHSVIKIDGQNVQSDLVDFFLTIPFFLLNIIILGILHFNFKYAAVYGFVFVYFCVKCGSQDYLNNSYQNFHNYLNTIQTFWHLIYMI